MEVACFDLSIVNRRIGQQSPRKGREEALVKEGGRERGREGVEEAEGTRGGMRRDFWANGGTVLDGIKKGNEDREDEHLFLPPFLLLLLLCGCCCCFSFSLQLLQQ